MTTTVDVAPSVFPGVRGVVRYRRWSPPGTARAAVLLLHGLGEHSAQYVPFVEAANAAGVEVWAPDQAGHGLSDGQRVLVEDVGQLVDDAETLLRRVRAARPGLPVVVMGHSLGASVAALLLGEVRHVTALGDPAAEVAGLVLTGSALTGTARLQALLAADLDPTTLVKDPAELVGDPGQAERVRADPLVWSGGLLPATLRALAAAAARTSRLLAIGALDHLPVLLVHGEDDDLAPVADARAEAAALARGRVVTYPGSRHNVLLDRDRDAAYAEVLRFVLAVTAR